MKSQNEIMRLYSRQHPIELYSELQWFPSKYFSHADIHVFQHSFQLSKHFQK